MKMTIMGIHDYTYDESGKHGSESLILFFVMFIERIKEEINAMFFENSPNWSGWNHPKYRLFMTYKADSNYSESN